MTGAYHVPMGQPADETLSPNPHYYVIQGRAAEIARTLGCPIGGAEHLFLGMLHDGGLPVSVISHLVDLGQAEEAVLSIIGSHGYSPPRPPRLPVHDGYVQMWGAEVAFEMGDSYLGVEHGLLAMIRRRETVPARALASLVDLDVVEAAILDAKNAPEASPPDDAVFLPEGQEMDGPLRRAIVNALPDGTTFGFSRGEDERVWMHVIGPDGSRGAASAREVLSTALASLNCPPDQADGG